MRKSGADRDNGRQKILRSCAVRSIAVAAHSDPHPVETSGRLYYVKTMDREEVIATLRSHEAELRAAGVERLSLFGSVARGDQTERSDVDVAIRLSHEAADGGFAYFGRLDALTRRIRNILGCDVDVVTEPIRTERLRRAVEKEAMLAF
jgi:hypothetical protein